MRRISNSRSQIQDLLVTTKVHKMRFVLFDQIRRRNPRALAPDEIHLRVNRAERQSRFKNQEHAAVKKKARP
jgi:hypothetical protein